MKFISHSPQETQDLAKDIISELKDTNTIALYGELGAGKTTFVQGLARELGIKKRILSPTYILMRTYQIPQQPIYNSLVHIDLYRVESAQDLKSIDLEQLFSDTKNLIVIEWAEKLDASQLKNALKIKFKTMSENQRIITFYTE